MIRITLQGIPPSLNRYAGRENSREYREVKKQWTDTVAWLARQHGQGPYERAVVRIVYHFPDRRRRDPDNYAGKMLLDGLVRGGLLVDDSFSNIRLELEGVCDGETGTEIIVSEA